MNEKHWKAIQDNDPRFDGIFYYALHSTKTVCRPSCTSRTPNPKNVVIFSDVSVAMLEGFRPCRRCKPDENAWKGYKEELVEEIRQYIIGIYHENVTLHLISLHVKKDPYYIQRTFKAVTGFTPLQYVHHLRILKAKSLMETKTLSITEIGLNLGYSNSGHFSTKFKEVVGVTPKEYRKSLQKNPEI
ncbi:Ada metal-binding domain-containing protein [Paenibacillus sp. FSL R10-2199]|uniref:bifunctional transcriptional activator/DNA repair enzyme AdaA n=1 Tax=Paenibacillus sp. FSL R10-2199 TaxID=2975348 RepID=UPI0030FC1DDF